MSDPSGFLGQSTRFLRRALIRFWLGSGLLIAICMVLLSWNQRQQDRIREAEQLVTVVRSSLQSALPEKSIHTLLENTISNIQAERYEGLSLLLVLNQKGEIRFSNRTAWKGLNIVDPLISEVVPEDPDFQAVVHCFRRGEGHCLSSRSQESWLEPRSASVVRPVEVAAASLGLPKQCVLVIVVFDPGAALVNLAGDLLLVLPVAMGLAGLLTLVLGSTLQGQLLPELSEQAQTDGLTSLMNRTLFMELAKELLAEAELRGSDMAFAILDLDHFKQINDTYGHACGDAALVQVADLLATVTRPEDLLCRFGGEEFALLLHGERSSGGKALERLRLQLEMMRLNHQGHQIPLRASIGAAATGDCGYNLDYLYMSADKALYVAKQSGRNRVAWNDGQRLIGLVR